jgi:hypothetical protein
MREPDCDGGGSKRVAMQEKLLEQSRNKQACGPE